MTEPHAISTEEEVDIVDEDDESSQSSSSLLNALRYLIQGAQSGTVSHLDFIVL